MQLLVLGRSAGEDGGNHHHGGAGPVTHLVDHDGGQNHAQQRQHSETQDHTDHDVNNHQDVVHYDGEAGPGEDGAFLLHENFVHGLGLT